MPRLLEVRPAATDLVTLHFDAPAEGYTTPGQFVEVELPDHKPGYFAIASSPGEPLQLLVRRQPGLAEALAAPAHPPRVSPALGAGFALSAIAGLPLVLLINGSGLSAARPVIAAELAAGLPRPVTLYLSALSPDRIPYGDELQAWRDAGVAVHLVYDPDSEHAPRGYVQDLARAHGWARPGVGLVLVGVPAMLKAARQAWLDAGADAAHVLTNL